MNVKILFDYMKLCRNNKVEPTIDGLKAFKIFYETQLGKVLFADGIL